MTGWNWRSQLGDKNARYWMEIRDDRANLRWKVGDWEMQEEGRRKKEGKTRRDEALRASRGAELSPQLSQP